MMLRLIERANRPSVVLLHRHRALRCERRLRMVEKNGLQSIRMVRGQPRQGAVMKIDQSSPMEHLKAFAIVFAIGYLVNSAVSLYQKVAKRYF